MIEYTAGLLFSNDKSRVALVRKNHGPENVTGQWNAIGGKVDSGKWFKEAMQREFQKETGVLVNTWSLFLTLKTKLSDMVYFYTAVDSKPLNSIKTTTDKNVFIFELDKLWHPTYYDIKLVSNLSWIIPMALSHKLGSFEKYEVVEG